MVTFSYLLFSFYSSVHYFIFNPSLLTLCQMRLSSSLKVTQPTFNNCLHFLENRTSSLAFLSAFHIVLPGVRTLFYPVYGRCFTRCTDVVLPGVRTLFYPVYGRCFTRCTDVVLPGVRTLFYPVYGRCFTRCTDVVLPGVRTPYWFVPVWPLTLSKFLDVFFCSLSYYTINVQYSHTLHFRIYRLPHIYLHVFLFSLKLYISLHKPHLLFVINVPS